MTDLAMIGLALDAFESDCGRYPGVDDGGFNALFVIPPDLVGSWRGPYLKPGTQLMDPWGNAYIFRTPGKPSSVPYRLVCLGPDGKEESADDITTDQP